MAKIKIWSEIDKMVQWLRRVFAPKSDNLSSIPRTHVVEVENDSTPLSSDLHMYCGISLPVSMCTRHNSTIILITPLLYCLNKDCKLSVLFRAAESLNQLSLYIITNCESFKLEFWLTNIHCSFHEAFLSWGKLCKQFLLPFSSLLSPKEKWNFKYMVCSTLIYCFSGVYDVYLAIQLRTTCFLYYILNIM